MDWDQATFYIGLAVLAMQGLNLYISTSIKLWVHRNFVSKTDFLNTLELWQARQGNRHV